MELQQRCRQPRKTEYAFILAVFLLTGCAAQLAEYDFIIVGAGAGGSLLANRLSEVSDWTVLLIEAGGEETTSQDIPLLAAFAQFTDANWAYQTEQSTTACLSLVDGRCNWPRGKVLGGTTVLNYMVNTRGNRLDYDGWADKGYTGWGYDDLLPYFLKFEDMLIPELAQDTTYHSTKGELPITYPRYHTQSATDFIEAGNESGYQILDYNAESQIGFSYLQTTIDDGLRVSANTAFLKPARIRQNLVVVENSLVTKIFIHANNQTAYGIQYNDLNILPSTAYARKEVIISAGAINSPQLLMLSGIGPKEDLEELGIPVIQDLQVGSNLQDHITLGTLYFTANTSIGIRFDEILLDASSAAEYLVTRNGTFSIPGGTEAVGYEDIDDDDGNPEIELFFAGGTLPSLKPVWDAWGGNEDIYNALEPISHIDSFMVFPVLMHPKSRGRLALQSIDPTDKPLLYHNYLTVDDDLDIIVKGINRTIELTKTEAFQRHGAELFNVPLPPCRSYEFASDAYWECAVRQTTFTLYHHCGSCKMGPDSDEDAVVDLELRVRGINNLRVVDASIIPFIPAAHLTTVTYMVAEKAAAAIKNDWNATA